MKINIKSLEYPENLRKIKKPPKQLYLKGNIELLKTPGIAIIGSRKCTEYGEKTAKQFSKELSIEGLTIISGMAEGIDSFAHIGSIEVKGNTIAVLPCGFNNIYPKQNIKLYEEILKNNGLVLTEYKEDEKATSDKFLERNRIVSGLAIGTLVIEGGHRSGTSVTANLTKEQGKNVFCIPSSLENQKGITPNRLIKEGAFLVTDVEDIIKKYPELNLKKRVYREEIIKIEEEKTIKEEYKNVYNELNEENPIHINEIAKRLKLDINEVSYKLTMLELEDKIVSLPGNNFRKK
ncbi:MAG: DNA-processing protein DprA [Clostridia bacterium]|nr:DNA-processing protein DprA [Clostridia bacterium]